MMTHRNEHARNDHTCTLTYGHTQTVRYFASFRKFVHFCGLTILVTLNASNAYAEEGGSIFGRFLQAPQQGKIISITAQRKSGFMVYGGTLEFFMKGDVFATPFPQAEGFIGVEVHPSFFLVRLTQGVASTHGFSTLPIIAGQPLGRHFKSWAFPTTVSIGFQDSFGFIGACFRHYSTGQPSFNPGINFIGAEFGVNF